MKKLILSEPFLRSTALFAVGCCAVSAGALVAPLAAPAIGVATVIGAHGLAALFKDKPECEKAAEKVRKAVGKTFVFTQDADSAAVGEAEKALGAALETGQLFTAARLSEALAHETRVVEALAALTLEGVAVRDPSFAVPGLRRDFASDVLNQTFAEAMEACAPFRDRALLTLAEITLAEVREMAADVRAARGEIADVKGQLAEMIAMLGQAGMAEAHDAGLNDVQVRELLKAFALENVPLDQAKEKLLSAAEELGALRLRLLRLTNDDPETRELKVQAAAAIDVGEIERARDLVLQAAERHRKAGEELAGALKFHRLSEAEALAEAAKIEAIRANYLEAAKHFERSLEISAPYDDALPTLYAIDLAGVLVQYAQMSPSAESLDRAISVLNEWVIASIDYSENEIQWKRAFSLIATAQAMLAEMSGSGNYQKLLEQSISNSKLLLKAIDHQIEPEQWCIVANTLGNAILTHGERGGSEAMMNQAIDLFREVVRICPKNSSNFLWSGSNGNLANALHSLAIRRSNDTSFALLDEAEKLCAIATALPRDSAPPERWMMVHVNSALVFKNKANFDDANRIELLQKAVDIINMCVDEKSKAVVPRLWASGKKTLGSIYFELSHAESDHENIAHRINSALSAYDESLEITTLASSPQDWAMTSENACIAQATLSHRTLDPEHVCSAARRMDQVVEVFESIGSPYHLSKATENRNRMRQMCNQLRRVCAGA